MMMTVKELRKKLEQFPEDIEIVLFFDAGGDDYFYEVTKTVQEGFLDEKADYFYTSTTDIEENELSIAGMKKMVYIA